MRVRFVGLLALMALVLASCGGASPEAGGPGEGIQVHGDWSIDIYNENGSLDRTVEFSNELTNEGQATVTGILSGELGSVGLWAITFGEIVEPVLCGSSQPCSIDPIVASAEAGQSNRFVLISGSTTVLEDGQIEFVKTFVGTCPVTVDCRAAHADGVQNPREVTARALDPADVASVSAGQTVDIRVEISFTSG